MAETRPQPAQRPNMRSQVLTDEEHVSPTVGGWVTEVILPTARRADNPEVDSPVLYTMLYIFDFFFLEN